MSQFFNFDAPDAAKIYDEKRCPHGVDVMCGLMTLHCGKPLKDIHILDAGCGTGQYAKAFAGFGAGKITLLDNNDEMIRIAQTSLKDEIQGNIIHDVVSAKLPEMPFEDGSFDVVVFNNVLHHLDSNSDGYSFPATEQTIRETKRILRPKGNLFILSALSTTMKQTCWFLQLHSQFKERLAKRFMSIEQYQKMFSNCGFCCINALNLLNMQSQTIFPDYWDMEGPLKESWRKATVLFDQATDEEIKEMENTIKELRGNGNLEEFMKAKDHSSERGIMTLLVAVPI